MPVDVAADSLTGCLSAGRAGVGVGGTVFSAAGAAGAVFAAGTTFTAAAFFLAAADGAGTTAGCLEGAAGALLLAAAFAPVLAAVLATTGAGDGLVPILEAAGFAGAALATDFAGGAAFRIGAAALVAAFGATLVAVFVVVLDAALDALLTAVLGAGFATTFGGALAGFAAALPVAFRAAAARGRTPDGGVALAAREAAIKAPYDRRGS